MVAVPAVTPVTTPVEAFTVATTVLLLLHVPPVLLELNEVVLPTQTAWVPLKVPAFGTAETVIVRVTVASAHPPVPVTV